MLKKLVRDTLMIQGRFSRTSLTMFISFVLCLIIGVIDFACNGYRSEVFFGFLGSALGSKISDSFSKKLHNDKL